MTRHNFAAFPCCNADGVGDAVQEVMLHLCSGDQAVLPKQAVQSGARSLLNTMGVDDVMGDAPKAPDWVNPHKSTLHDTLCCCQSYYHLCSRQSCLFFWSRLIQIAAAGVCNANGYMLCCRLTVVS